ncbi:hypothetical protein NCCP2716_12310 [Sporosarcina sp. NCCP-2716]|uniref:class I SAM-dependent methyltransferase n=1 Tax=Sporosarcina sp. NCCP-2716 TaxID=2943679 RepID=UPI002040EC5A|nr:class I SAM-dependent methyltransferase [Sporosarcina sp. NCCP-2716]GKV68733.1 hypothetical protein NCCP2716_12310 [Sporosarcina sp. NCCP-2716]
MSLRKVITTAGRPDSTTESRALAAQQELGYPVIRRNKRSVSRLMDEYGADILVAGKERYELFRTGHADDPFFFHPDTAVFRLKRLLHGETDPLVEAAGLTAGSRFLDCTLGLATDSIVASFAVGPSGRAAGTEADPDVAFITRQGLRQFPASFNELKLAMERIEVVQQESLGYLRTLDTASFDVVYLDPMFSAAIEESSNFAPLRHAGAGGGLTGEWVAEAARVAASRVVLKGHYTDPSFEEYGFTRIRRPNTKFHFGYIET